MGGWRRLGLLGETYEKAAVKFHIDGAFALGTVLGHKDVSCKVMAVDCFIRCP
jgi:hypothetical protein